MAARKVTSSERKGILAVAAIALLVSGIGMLVPHCGGNGVVAPPRVEVVYSPDSVASGSRLSGKQDTNPDQQSGTQVKKPKAAKIEQDKNKTAAKRNKESTAAKRSGKDYPTRSPLDEPVPSH